MLDAAGKDWMVIETVGVGQDEVDIVRTADVVDRDARARAPATRCRRSRPASWRSPTSSWSTRRTARAPTASWRRSRRCWRSRRRRPATWRPPIVRTQATTGQGVPELLAADRARSGRTRRPRRPRGGGCAAVPAARAARGPVHGSRGAARAGAGRARRLLDRIADRGARSYTAAERHPRAGRSGSGQEALVKATLDHIGIAVGDLAQALAFYRDALGPRGRAARGGAVAAGARPLHARWARRPSNCSKPTAPDSPIAKFIEKRGPGIHHITLRVDDIHAALAR